MEDWRAALDRVVERHGLEAGAADRLAPLLRCVRDDPDAPTTVRAPEDGVHAHVEDSLTALALPQLHAASVLADLGSGAGFPGLPLAVALPATRVVLVESSSRKCAFLERAVAAVGVSNVEIACVRVEEWPRHDADVVCARAVASLAVLVEYAAPVLTLGGALVAWKGRRDQGEERDGATAAAEVGLERAQVVPVEPFPGAEHRTLHVYLKVRQTPSRFPRRPGMARKRPLAGSG